MSQKLESKDLGSVSAYGDALAGGYTGTKETLYAILFADTDEVVLPVNPTEKPSERTMFISDLSVREEVPIPVYIGGKMTYDGTEQTAQFENYDPEKMTVTGNTGTYAGDYTAVFSLKGNQYKWADGGTWNQRFAWTINKAQVTIPTISGTYTYDGEEQTVAIDGLDDSFVMATGIKATNAGDYATTFALKNVENCEWTDGTTEDKIYQWSIARADGSILLSTDSVVLSDDNSSATVSATATGTVAVASSDESIVKVSATGNDITVALAEQGASGNANITVTSQGNTNYSSASIVLSVVANYTVPSWSDGSDEEIATALSLYYAGVINLQDEWSVGETRQVDLPEIAAINSSYETQAAQTVEMILLNAGGKTLIDGNECAFAVGFKLGTRGALDKNNTNKWSATLRREWLNSNVLEAIPSSLRGIFKQHENLSMTGGGSNAVISIQDYFSLPAAVEVGYDVMPYHFEGVPLSWLVSNYAELLPAWTRTPYSSKTGTYAYPDASRTSVSQLSPTYTTFSFFVIGAI